MKKNMPLYLLLGVIVLLAVLIAYQGMEMHSMVTSAGGLEEEFHKLQMDYWANTTKSMRDTAAAGSELNQSLAEIMNFPSTLLTLKLGGIGKVLGGIFLLLLGILVALVSIPMRLEATFAGTTKKKK